MILHRAAVHEALPEALRPVLGIQLAPPVVGGVTYMSLSSGTPDLIALMLLGYGLYQALMLLRLLPWIRQQAFGPGYWAFSFGVATCRRWRFAWSNEAQRVRSNGSRRFVYRGECGNWNSGGEDAWVADAREVDSGLLRHGPLACGFPLTLGRRMHQLGTLRFFGRRCGRVRTYYKEMPFALTGRIKFRSSPMPVRQKYKGINEQICTIRSVSRVDNRVAAKAPNRSPRGQRLPSPSAHRPFHEGGADSDQHP